MKKITSEEARNYIKTLPVMKKRNLTQVFENVNPDGESYDEITLYQRVSNDAI